MKSPTKYTNATHRFTNFAALCNDCSWYSPADTLSIDAAIRHAISRKHNVTTITSVYATIHAFSTET
jgi:hypothetical protein